MSSSVPQAQSGRIVATLAFNGEEKLAINFPSTGTRSRYKSLKYTRLPSCHIRLGCAAGKVSDSVVHLKKEVVGFMSQHMTASNLANDEGTCVASTLSYNRNHALRFGDKTFQKPNPNNKSLLLLPTWDILSALAVDMLEEVVSDDEDIPKKGIKGQKRKR